MDKKVTVKDVAKAAGVSVATVSYIMNNRTDMRISDATRKKVLQIANLLNYTPSFAAKSLATGRNKIIGVSYRLQPETPSRNLEITEFITLLIERLNRLAYDVLYMPIRATQDNIPINSNIDGIIAIDLSHQEFRILADNYLVPLINVDMLVNEQLFFQIYYDIPQAISLASSLFHEDCYLITDRYDNENYMNYIINEFPENRIVCYQDLDSKEFFKTPKNLIVIGEYLALLVQAHVATKNLIVIAPHKSEHLLADGIRVIPLDVDKKANLTINYLLNAIDRKCDVSHDCKIRIERK